MCCGGLVRFCYQKEQFIFICIVVFECKVCDSIYMGWVLVKIVFSIYSDIEGCDNDRVLEYCLQQVVFWYSFLESKNRFFLIFLRYIVYYRIMFLKCLQI